MSDGEMWAHSRRDETGRVTPHELSAHLQAVARLAGEFAERFGADWAQLAGLWHDLGKFRPGFQRYIRLDGNAHIEGRVGGRDKTHSAAGALHALATLEAHGGPAGRLFGRTLAYVIAGHHAGLGDWHGDLDDRLNGSRAADSRTEWREAVDACLRHAPTMLPLPQGFDLRQAVQSTAGLQSPNKLARSLWVRLLFSALVDADFLDTEAFMRPGDTDVRGRFPGLADYRTRLEAHLEGLATQANAAGRAQDPVIQARRSVLAQCHAKASLPPGVFTLTVPTGGGKTLSSLAFALAHAVSNGQQRIVYAIPYTSIIEQTASVFGDIFGEENVVEHHSQAEADPRDENAASRLACENWDAPLIVTTTVQLFESLFASRTSRCRKLHRLCGSVIVLDEAQLLPPAFLQPILDVLDALVRHHGVTLLLCTATQPALARRTGFDPRQNIRGLPTPTPIVENEAALFHSLERVSIRWPDDLHTPAPWPQLVDELSALDCVLAIVGTRADALELTRALPAGTLHLSAAMCGAHRKSVIDAIRARLQARAAGDATPLRVVSTQLIEAGVDVDFPVVYRALAGLDSIAQSAGRCNREGRLERGELVVFVRPVPRALTLLRAGVDTTRELLAEGLGASLPPAVFTRYFEKLYRSQRLDSRDIVACLADEEGSFRFDFRTAAEKFKLVDDERTAPLVVRYWASSEAAGSARVDGFIRTLENGDASRWVLRGLQRYTVNAPKTEIEAMQRLGDVAEPMPGLYLLKDELRYDARFGFMPKAAALSATSLYW